MNRVTIELWLWLGRELGDDFESPTPMRSLKHEGVAPGTTIRGVLERLAARYPAIGRVVFDMKTKNIHPHVVVNYNDQVISPHVVQDQILKDGDKITILPMYVGG